VRVNEDILFIWLNGDQHTFKQPFAKVQGSRIV